MNDHADVNDKGADSKKIFVSELTVGMRAENPGAYMKEVFELLQSCGWSNLHHFTKDGAHFVAFSPNEDPHTANDFDERMRLYKSLTSDLIGVCDILPRAMKCPVRSFVEDLAWLRGTIEDYAKKIFDRTANKLAIIQSYSVSSVAIDAWQAVAGIAIAIRNRSAQGTNKFTGATDNIDIMLETNLHKTIAALKKSFEPHTFDEETDNKISEVLDRYNTSIKRFHEHTESLALGVLMEEVCEAAAVDAKARDRKAAKQARRQREKAAKTEAAVAKVGADLIEQVMSDASVAADKTTKADDRIRSALARADASGEVERVKRALELHGAAASKAVVDEARAVLRAARSPRVVVGVEVGEEEVGGEVVVAGLLV